MFLPSLEGKLPATVVQNSLIQTGEGWSFVVLAVLITGAAYRAYRQGRRTVAVIILGALGVLNAILLVTDPESLTLYALDERGDPKGRGEVARAGIGIYLSGIGGVLSLLGGVQMRSGESRLPGRGGPDATTVCPDCAETVLAAAKVCKHCGHRFAPPGEPA